MDNKPPAGKIKGLQYPQVFGAVRPFILNYREREQRGTYNVARERDEQR